MLVYVKLITAMALWGGAFVAGRLLADDLGPAAASFVRFVMAAVLLMALGLKLDPKLLSPSKRQLGMFLLLGATGVFAYNILFMEGLHTVPAGRGAIIIATNPVLTAVAAALFFGESLRRGRALGVALSLFGALTVVTRGDYLSVVSGISPGDLILFCAVTCWSAYSLAGKKTMQHATPIAAVSWSAMLGALLLAPAAMADGLLTDLPRAGITEWGCLVYLAVCATVVGFFWYYEGIKALGAARAAAFINLVPVSASILGYLILGESLALSTFVGGTLVLAGVWLTNRPQPTGQR